MTKIVSVFIPVYNGRKYLAECIRGVLNQELPRGFRLEVLITDSGSTDGSVDIIKSFGNKVIFDQIPNSEFGHGKTRQRAVNLTKGDFIAFLTQDATPASNQWLLHMLEPFFVSEKIGIVFGRQIPRPYAEPTIKREVSSVFGSFGPENAIILHEKYSQIDGWTLPNYNYFFSDVNSAIRRDINKEIPFRDVAYAEDQALAEDCMEAGYIKAYAAQGAVYHSNEYTSSDYYGRKFDEFLGLQNSTKHTLSMKPKELFLGWIKPTIADWRFILNDNDYNSRAKLKFLALSIFYNINEKRAKWDAIRFKNNGDQINKRSLEKKNLAK